MRRLAIALLLAVSLLAACNTVIQRRRTDLDTLCSSPTPHAYTLRGHVWVGCVSMVPDENTFCCP